jgi:c-Rel proto-oncogene protein
MFNPDMALNQNSLTVNRSYQEETLLPYVIIETQPAPRELRFRYECEGRFAGSIPGANSTPQNKTYPTIKLMNYTGRAFVYVSCVTEDFPYK